MLVPQSILALMKPQKKQSRGLRTEPMTQLHWPSPYQPVATDHMTREISNILQIRNINRFWPGLLSQYVDYTTVWSGKES
jgi:hypothetical protein